MKLKNTLFVLLVLSVILSAGVPTMAQDKIITKEGETHEVYNVEVSDKYVFYSKEKAADSPILRMGKDVVLMIRYQDGTKKLFTGEEAGDEASLAGSNVASSGTSAKQEAAEDVSLSEEELTKLKNQYWVEVGYKNDKELDKGDKEAKSMFCQFDFCHDAVLADKNVELQVKTLKTDMDSYKYASWWQATNYAVQITVCNKTNQVIYLDLGNCFFIRGSEASPFYIPTSTSQTNGKSGGVGVNLGSVANALNIGGVAGTLAQGVNVGGGSSSSATTVTYSQRVISLPPMSSKKLDAQQIFIPGQEKAYGLEVAEVKNKTRWGICPYLKSLGLMRGQMGEWNEDNSPMKLSTFISYSLDDTFSNAHSLKASLYACKVIALPRESGAVIPTAQSDLLTENFSQALFFMAEVTKERMSGLAKFLIKMQ